MAKHDKSPVGISTILNPVPVVMVSSAGKDPGTRPNIMTVAWAGTVNSEPPMVSVSIRKSRYSHKLISETGEFVINLVSKSLCKPCDYCGVRSGADEDKFAKCGLTPVKAEGLEYAYAIKEAPVSISCKVKSVTELGSHDMFIGEIVAVTADSYLLDDKGRLCLDNAKLVAYNHGEYFLLGEKLGFFGYSVASADVLKKRMGNK
ncbi:MAG: flavin reductase family protein [Saccharofermentans sp.]|jgi:flavin reductase (DIM6/NTAB) family NADH-FMN oxidoreductase RutF|nr:flavin reductase family protein [Saccharofermentans sp.]